MLRRWQCSVNKLGNTIPQRKQEKSRISWSRFPSEQTERERERESVPGATYSQLETSEAHSPEESGVLTVISTCVMVSPAVETDNC